MIKRLNSAMIKAQNKLSNIGEKAKELCSKKSSGSAVVEAAILIVIAIIVCVIFKDQILDWLGTLFDNLTDTTTSLFGEVSGS